MSKLPNPLDHRKPEYNIESIFLKRWSPRAMSGEAMSMDELMPLFEAARWAPSTYNEQEWLFLVARRDTAHFATFLDLLMPANRDWCIHAAALVVVTSRTKISFNGQPNPVHSFDAGAAFENLALQGAHMGLVVHGMAGFDRDKARKSLNIPEEQHVDAMIAIGKPGDPAKLPEALRSREVPSGRKPVREIVREGGL